MAIATGTTISHYRILSRLGAGGMGEVYKAHDSTLDRPVALKILPLDLTEDEDRLRRFVQEARSASALNHPHIITIYEVGQAQTTGAGDPVNKPETASESTPSEIHYIAMEFVDGDTLRDKARLEKADLKRLLEYLAQVAEGLSKAHSSGIIHRDLKPENIMITQDGYAKILDFGLAKLNEPKQVPADNLEEAATAIMEHTQPGMIMGTLGYMSPEQVQGKVVDQRSDIFSFGCILYEVTTGQKPFAGESIIDSMHKIVYSPAPPIEEFSPDTPSELQRIIRKCLSKAPDERYQSIKDVAIDLRDLIREYDTMPPVTRSFAPAPHTIASGVTSIEQAPIQNRRILIAAAAILALAVIGFGIYKLIGSVGSTHAPPFQKMDISKLTSTGKATDAAISPDGKYVVHVISDAGQRSLWVRQVATSSNVQIVPPADVTYTGLTFSPDGNYIYYVKGETKSPVRELYQVPVLGGQSKKVIVDIDSSITFAPGGKQIAFTRADLSESEMSLMVANADGSQERKLSTRKFPDAYLAPAWSPDGKIIACSATTSAGGGRTINVVAVNADNGAEAPITSQRWLNIPQLEWFSDGSGLAMIAVDPASRLYQVWHLAYPGGETHKITNDLNNYISLSMTADSKTIAAVQLDQIANLWVAPIADASRAQQITSGTVKYNSLSWTPNGKIIYGSNAGGSFDVWMVGPDGADRKQITSDSGVNIFPTVTADGRYIVFSSNRGNTVNTFNIWRTDLDGSNAKQLTNGSGDLWPDCSPDGQWVIYASVGAGKPTLWKVGIDGGEPKQLLDKLSMLPSVSPDGELIACNYWNEQQGSQTGIAIIPFEGGQPLKILNLPQGIVRWTPDGRALTYIDNRAGVSNIWSQSIDGGPPKQLTDFKNDQIFEFNWSRDGKRLAWTRGIITNDVVLIKERDEG